MLSLVLPERCIHCARPTIASESLRIAIASGLRKYLCRDCHDLLDRMVPPTSEVLLERAEPLAGIKQISSVRSRVYFVRDSLVQSIVHSFKYGEMPMLGRMVGASIAPVLIPDVTEFDLVVPVPLHRTREAERGYNQSKELAKGLVERLSIPVYSEKLIRRIRPTQSQAQLSISERYENVQGAFKRTKLADSVLFNKRVLIVDDVLTTGSTIAAIAEELVLAEPKSIGVLVFAAAV